MRSLPNYRWAIVQKHAAACSALACAFLIAASPVRAEDVFDSVLKGVGLEKPGETNGISYRERSPLVLPPGRELRPPESSAALTNPAWPVEPEIKRAKELKAKSLPRSGDRWAEDGRPMSRDELELGRGRSGDVGNTKSEYDGQRPLNPNEMNYKGGIFGSLFGGSKNEDNAKFTGEPPRASLTDPPVGYQTPSPDQPYGLGKERVVNKPPDPTARGLEQR